MDDFRRELKYRIENLEAEIRRVRKLYEKTLKYQDIDPEVSLLQARKSAEAICKSIYIKEGLHKLQGKQLSKLMLNDVIQLLERNNILPDHITINLRTIQAFGNYGSHYQPGSNGVITSEYIKPCLLGLATVFNWYVDEYYNKQDLELLVENDFNDRHGITTNFEGKDIQDESSLTIETLRIVGNHAAPYRIFKDNNTAGIYFDIMKEIAKRLNLNIVFIKKPYKTALVMMKDGQADIMVGPNKTEEREHFMIFSRATLPRERKGFFVHISGKPIISYEDLYNRLLIVSRGKVYSDQIDEDKSLKKVTITDYTQGFELLEKDADYVMVMPEKEGEHLIDEYDYDVLASPFYMDGKTSYLALSKKSKHGDLFDKIDNALEDLKKEGVYDEIMHYY